MINQTHLEENERDEVVYGCHMRATQLILERRILPNTFQVAVYRFGYGRKVRVKIVLYEKLIEFRFIDRL